MSDTDTSFLQHAVDIATQSVTLGGGPFGAIIVRNNEIIGRGNNQVTLINDPTAHAEIMAIRDACNKLKNFSLEDCTLYTSCEPCPMCMSAIYWARINRVVFASTEKDAADAGFDDAFIARELCSPYEQRSIKVEHLSCHGHDKCFIEWNRKQNKIEY
ncbi:MAG: nucleoside deaminase [Gammaproteobacteria bacterium]|nr:nucleoside deaminase [Gammaproteobacteria bacterium]MCW8911231.1 nucleoside deaminase [Gammaproteobacteria bacterium]MCW9005380.1 nucleoside deaminase [Gammaproteobacteria bacterium]